MDAFLDFLGRVLRGVLRLALGVAALIFLLSLLLATLVVVLGVSLWSLLTGRKPAPAMVFSRFRQTSERYAQGVWPTGAGAPRRSPPGDVVDVQATEVPSEDSPPDQHHHPRGGGPDGVARMMRY